MNLDFLLLFLLTFTGGLSYAWLGVGAGAVLVPILPYVSNLSALESVQVALLMGFLISFINGCVFAFQKLILWEWVFKALFFIIASAFLAGFCIGFLSSFQIRFLLWFFFLFILLFPYILYQLHLSSFSQHPSFKSESFNKVQELKQNQYKMSFFYLCNILAGFSAGLTGVGGGLILSPFFHESRLIPSKNIPAVMSVLFLCVTGFSLLGQAIQSSLSISSEFVMVGLQILPGYLLGSIAGYVINAKQSKPQLGRYIIRLLVLLIFIKMTLEIFL